MFLVIKVFSLLFREKFPMTFKYERWFEATVFVFDKLSLPFCIY